MQSQQLALALRTSCHSLSFHLYCCAAGLSGAGYVTDGTSFKPQLQATPPATTRDRLVFEYWGMGYTERGPCKNGTTPCPGAFTLDDFMGGFALFLDYHLAIHSRLCDSLIPTGGPQALEDAPSNTWAGIRIKNATHDIKYAEYRTDSCKSLAFCTVVQTVITLGKEVL